MKTELLALAVLVSTATNTQADSLVARKCKSFTPEGSAFRARSDPIRASPVFFCNQAGTAFNNHSFWHTCQATDYCVMGNSAGTIHAKPTINITVADDAAARNIFDLVEEATNLKFDENGVKQEFGANEAGACLSPGEGGYITQDYDETCINGTLSDCEDGEPSHGTAVKVCAPIIVDGSKDAERRLSLSWTVYGNATEEDARNHTDNPLESASGRAWVNKAVFLAEIALFCTIWAAL